MTTTSVTRSPYDTLPDGPFGEKPEGVCAGFWVDPMFWVEQTVETHHRDGQCWDDEECITTVINLVADAMYGQRRHDEFWEDEIASQNHSAHYFVIVAGQEPDCRVTGDTVDGPVYVAEPA